MHRASFIVPRIIDSSLVCDVDNKFPYGRGTRNVPLGLLHTLSGERVLPEDVDLNRSVLDQLEEFRCVQSDFLGGRDVVQEAA